jgi:ABC-2 type transport system ATP-binding protein
VVEASKPDPRDGTIVIELKNVSIAIRGRAILGDVTATLPSASVTHLAGINGSGKTTLIRAIAGIQRYSGSILFDGKDVGRVRSRIYVCWDDAAVFPYLNGYENLRMLLGRPIGRDRILAAAPELAPDSLLRQKGRALSHGHRKRLHLVAALLSGADYLLLDETLNSIDAPTTKEVSSALAQRAAGATVLMTGHHGDSYEQLATHRLRIDAGTLHAADEATAGMPA